MSDHFSFLDHDDKDLSTKGNGGMRQMHSYATINDTTFSQDVNVKTTDSGGNKIKDGDTSLLDRYKQERDRDLQMYGPKPSY